MVGTVCGVSEPTLPAIHEGLFESGESGGSPALIGGRCPACGSVCFPLQEICPYCSGSPVESLRLSRTGALWAWTAVTAPPPGYEGPIPYGFGVVELPEGVRIVSRLTESDPAALQYGQAMSLVLVPLPFEGTNVMTFAFAAAEAGEADGEAPVT